jgi:hypothetical protein
MSLFSLYSAICPRRSIMHVVTVACVRVVSNLKNLIAKYNEPLYMQESNHLGPILLMCLIVGFTNKR